MASWSSTVSERRSRLCGAQHSCIRVLNNVLAHFVPAHHARAPTTRPSLHLIPPRTAAEIDKIISNKSKHSGDASAEGVQRDMLPLIEGTTVDVRRFGNVRTDYMLFIACGAFHEHKPSELLAELQGRLPIRVELKGLDARDFERILTETKFNLLDQQRALLSAEGIDLRFSPEAVHEIARLAAEVNRQVENIGARRLHTVIERVMEDISFDAPDMARGAVVTVDRDLVRAKLLPLLEKQDLSKFIL